ncbi:hypothetical protein GN109_16685 [Collimonas pratensis]|uniref:SUKH-4 family immunity protein n=1 Tax=Collimonas pratensis TaxID=279113 RepID=UPI00143E083A|nr:SUKH-4 family immunity protein [Collimonas pratensis]NKI71064.1 hypothetical protein [Collimonas pratensis]
MSIEMTPVEFRKRFLTRLVAFSNMPKEVSARLSAFVHFDEALLFKFSLTHADIEFLTQYGLPRDAAPFLNFNAYSEHELDDMRALRGVPKNFFPIGQNGSGDMLGIDISSREVVYLNHDRDMERVFVNTSLYQFAECLCLYQEHSLAKTMVNCLSDIQRVDSNAAEKNTMWATEVTDYN